MNGEAEMKTRKNCSLRRRILGEALEPRHLLSAVGFVTHELVHPSDANGPGRFRRRTWTAMVTSMFSLRPRRDGKIAWYENTDGAGTFGQQQVITTQRSRSRVSVCGGRGW